MTFQHQRMAVNGKHRTAGDGPARVGFDVQFDGPAPEIAGWLPVSALVRGFASSYSPRDARIRSDGMVFLPASASVDVTDTSNALRTNAARHGALSNTEGRVTISRSLQRREDVEMLDLKRVGSGGPPVAQRQAHGFGSRLLPLLRRDADGSSALAMHPDGAGVTVSTPVKAAAI